MGKTELYKAPKDYDYNEWAKRAGIGEDRPEPAEANPDVLPEFQHEPTTAEEFIREMLDNPKIWLSLFTPNEQAVFFAVFIDGQPYRIVAKLLGKKSKRSIHQIVIKIREKIAAEIAKREELTGGR